MVPLLVLLAGCQDAPATGIELDSPTSRPPSGVNRTLYPDTDGELYPDDSAFKATIDTKSASFANATCDLPNHGCVVTLEARHNGLWNGTTQIISLYNDGNANPTYEAPEDWTCTQRGDPTGAICFKKELVHVAELEVPCGVEISGNVQHRAWWLGLWTVSGTYGSLSLQLSPFRIGEVVKPSFLSKFKAPACLEEGGGSGTGGGTGQTGCVHYYAIWYDPDTGEIEQSKYLFSVCGGYAQ